MSFLFVCAFSLFLTGIGWPVVLQLDRGGNLNSGERLAAAFLIGCFGVYLGVFLIGLYRLDAVSMWALVAICGVAGTAGLRRMPWASFSTAMKAEIRVARTDKWAGILWLGLVVVAISGLLQGMAPPNDYDSLMYHMSQPQFDIEMGRLSIPWDRALGTELFPALAGHLSRLSLATMNAGVAQMLHGMMGLVAALGAAMLTARMGYGRVATLLAAIFFLSTRVVIWEMGTVEVDVPLAAFTVLAVLAYHSFRQSGNLGTAVLFGLMIGGGILVKYLGFVVALAFVPIIVLDLLRRRVPFVASLAAAFTALIVLAPHLTRNFLITGNPIFPLFNTIFNPGKHQFFQFGADGYGTGREFVDLLITPWNMFISPMHLFDGMIYGAPFLLAFAPLILMDPQKVRHWAAVLLVAGCYYAGWFYLLDSQVRFLLPIMPVMAAMAAVGATLTWRLLSDRLALRAAFFVIALTLGINQAFFVGIYGLLRLPVALGVMDPGTYHLRTPTMNGAFYGTCGYIRENLKPGELYFSNLQPHSFYCPQAPTVHIYFPDEARWWLESDAPPPEPSLQEFIERSEQASLRYFFVPIRSYNRRNDTAEMIIQEADLSKARNGRYLQAAFRGLTPLTQGPYTAVYDGPQVINNMKKQLQAQQK